MNILTNSIQDKNEFAKFIRDLSSNLTNVKHLLEDYENSKKEELKDKKKKLPVFIVHELGNTYKTLAQAKAAINFLGR